MPIKIRLRRMGRKKKPHYRIVVADSASPRDGRFVETLGYYKPLTDPARLVLNLERVDHWLGQGADPSGTVKTLIGRLVRKEALGFDAEGRHYLYFPKVAREACVRAESRSFADRVFGGAPNPMLLHMVREADLSGDEIAELRRILGEKEGGR